MFIDIIPEEGSYSEIYIQMFNPSRQCSASDISPLIDSWVKAGPVLLRQMSLRAHDKYLMATD